MSGVAVAIGASAVIGAGASMYSASQAKPGQGGVSQVEQPQYSWNEGLRKTQADYVSGALQNLQEGKAPQWWQESSPAIKQGLTNDLKQTYYGNAGTRNGLINQSMAAGTMAGLKGKRAFTPGQQAIMDYGTKKAQIDQYMAQQGVNIMQNQEQTMMQTINGMQSGPGAQAVPWSTQGQQGTDYSGLANGLSTAAQQWGGFKGSTMTPTNTNLSYSSGYVPQSSGGLTSYMGQNYSGYGF